MTASDTRPLALILGATGGMGGVVAARLLAEGWRVRALNRDPEAARRRTGASRIEWVGGDAMVPADVISAAHGAQVIVHAVNPAGYRNWEGLQMPMLESTIAAARASGARIVFAGTVYNYGPDAFPVIDEHSEQHPISRKGEVRVRMETALRAAAADGVKVLILRMGDFFGLKPGSDWLTQGIIAQNKPIAAVSYPGNLDITHTWVFLPDVGETVARLLASNLADFETFQMEGHRIDGHQFAAALEAAAGRKLKVGRLPWALVSLLAPFNETFRELLEMRYLWQRPVLLDGARLAARIGPEPRTPLAQALRATLKGAGALPKVAA